MTNPWLLGQDGRWGLSKRPQARRARVIQAIRDHLSEMVTREVKDPRVRDAGVVTVHNVDLNGDMSVAIVYVSFYGAAPEATQHGFAGLCAAAGYLRGPLARRMNLARAPALRFVLDTSPEFTARLAEIRQQDRQRAHQHQDDDSDDDPAVQS